MLRFSGDMNIGVDAENLHIFNFQEINVDGEKFDLATISLHEVIRLDRVTSFASGVGCNFNCSIVSIKYISP